MVTSTSGQGIDMGYGSPSGVALCVSMMSHITMKTSGNDLYHLSASIGKAASKLSVTRIEGE